jgi:acyl dehydratase
MDENRTADAEPRIINVEAPYFEDLKVGQLFSDAPAVTLTAGHAAFHDALFGDRLRLLLGEHTDEILATVLELSDSEIANLHDEHVVEGP